MALIVVCLVDRRRKGLAAAIRKAGITAIESFTTDQAVAVCVSRQVDAVVLDQELFVELDDWSVAQSVKLVRPSICVLLATRAGFHGQRLPRGVDVMLPRADVAAIVGKLKQIASAEAS